ncbi:MAG TPA: NEW3 domain-containing protein [Acidobacteriota bacterium]|nr:NEW3 domain-containing protein [Acidobacteriota bacterium]
MRRLFLFFVMIIPCPCRFLGAQPAQAPISDEQRRFLEVRRRQIDLSSARTALQRTQDLYKLGLIPKTDLDRAQTTVDTAQLNYQEAVLSLLSLQPRLTVTEATKYQSKDGRKFVRLTVQNLTPTFDDSQFRMLSNFEGADPIPESLRTRDISDIFISLRATGDPGTGPEATARGTTIALPYEVHIPELKYSAAKTMEFQLLRDVNSVVVGTTYKGQNQETVIQLQQAETENVVTVTPMQISQEADLGSQATFDLKLERSSVDVRQFQLKAVNLPHQISYSFVDPTSQARLSQVNFPAGVTQQTLGLRLFLPERADEQAVPERSDGQIRMDSPLEFWVLVMDASQSQQFQQERKYDVMDIERSRAGRARLLIIPRGVGRIEVSATSLFSEIQTGETVDTNVTIRNPGTRRLDNIKLTTEYPLNWRVEVAPDIVPVLDINRETAVKLKIIPPSEVPVGDYEVRIKTESYAYNRRVPSEDKIYRVSVKAQTNVWGTAALVGGLLLIVVGIVIFGVKLTRR